MKSLMVIIFVLTAFVSNAQKNDYYTKKGLAIEGYDVVSYFEGTPTKGNKKLTTQYDGSTFAFATKAHLEEFKTNPEKYVPAYGGYCAYAVAVKGEKVSIDPETYEIRNDKLYLFYNAWGTNTLKRWNQEDPAKLQAEADKKWEKIKKKKKEG